MIPDADFDAIFNGTNAFPDLSWYGAMVAVDPDQAERLVAFSEKAITITEAEDAARDPAHPFQQDHYLRIIDSLRRQSESAEQQLMEAPCNPVSGVNYESANAVLLTNEAARCEFSDPRWLTLRQAVQLGASLRSNQLGTRILFWVFRDDLAAFSCPRLFTTVVFNAQQFEGMVETAL